MNLMMQMMDGLMRGMSRFVGNDIYKGLDGQYHATRDLEAGEPISVPKAWLVKGDAYAAGYNDAVQDTEKAKQAEPQQ